MSNHEGAIIRDLRADVERLAADVSTLQEAKTALGRQIARLQSGNTIESDLIPYCECCGRSLDHAPGCTNG